MNDKANVFDFQAEVGLTKHAGSLEATEELVELCHIDEGKYVLDVGCGVGVTACYLAKRQGCQVVGVDISGRMIERAKERAKREGVEDRVEFRVADVQSLPFEDDLFDIVIGESITVFPEDKQRTVNEYVRVTKPGGYVGLNESTWMKTPPPTELVEWVSQDLSGNAEVLSADGWVGLLEGSGLRDVVVRTHEISPRGEVASLIRRYGLGDMLRVWCRALRMYVRNRASWAVVKAAGAMPKNALEYFGYGTYVGRKSG